MSKLALLGGRKIREKPFFTRAVIGSEEKKRAIKVLDSGVLSGFVAKTGEDFLGGREVREFESIVKDYFGAKYAISVNSATAGLHAAVAACGIGPEDEVIVTPYTMSATAAAILLRNATPVFSDIEENTFCLDPDKIEQKITPRTKAIMVVHLFGCPANMEKIFKIAKKHKLFVIEDCAQAPGALYNGKLVGTLGDIGIFSLNQHKTITCGEGGFAITNDKNLALRIQLVRNHGEAVVGDMDLKDASDIIGLNYRMTELEAAVSIGQFKKLDTLNKHRIRLAEYLTGKLSKFKGLILPETSARNKHVYFVYPIRFKEKAVGIPRDIFVKALNKEGIPFGAGYVKPLYLEPIYRKKNKTGYSKGICPVAERMHEKELMLTGVCRYPHTKSDIDDVFYAFEKIFANLHLLEDIK